VALIHDAIDVLIRDDVEIVEWANCGRVYGSEAEIVEPLARNDPKQ
jgi:hypothetical protein